MKQWCSLIHTKVVSSVVALFVNSSNKHAASSSLITIDMSFIVDFVRFIHFFFKFQTETS